MESLSQYFDTSKETLVSLEKETTSIKDFFDGFLKDFKETPLELYLYLTPVPVFVYLTSPLPKSIRIFTNVVVVGLYTNYTFKTFK